MTADLYIKIACNDEEKKRILDAVGIINEVKDMYSKTGIAEAEYASSILRQAVGVLNGVIDGEYL